MAPRVVDAADDAKSKEGTGLVSRLPSWLARLLPGRPTLQDPSSSDPTAAAGGTAAAAEVDSNSNEMKQMIEKLKDADIDEVLEQLRAELGEPPLPQPAPVPRTHPDYAKYYDWRRISYLRRYQVIRIASQLEPSEKERLLLEGLDLAKDTTFVQSVAERTGMYIDYEVRDMIKVITETREFFRDLHTYTQVLGYPHPRTEEDRDKFRQRIKNLRAREKQGGAAGVAAVQAPHPGRARASGASAGPTPLVQSKDRTLRASDYYQLELERRSHPRMRLSRHRKLKKAHDYTMRVTKTK